MPGAKVRKCHSAVCEIGQFTGHPSQRPIAAPAEPGFGAQLRSASEPKPKLEVGIASVLRLDEGLHPFPMQYPAVPSSAGCWLWPHWVRRPRPFALPELCFAMLPLRPPRHDLRE